MSKKAVSWLYREIPKLVAKGILTPQAARKLREYYPEAKSPGKKWFLLIVCGVTGALLIGLGIISLFAHNWEELSRGVRAVLSFMPLIIGQGLLAWVLVKRPKSDALKESTATFLTLMVGASIALISQTYNIPGSASGFTLTWMLLILPLVYLAKSSIPALIYLIGITTWSGFFWDNPLKAILFWPLAALIIPHFIGISDRATHRVRTTLLSLAMVICFCIAAGSTLGRAWQGSWTIIYASIYAIFYFIGSGTFSGQHRVWHWPFRFGGMLGIIILSFMFTYKGIWEAANYAGKYGFGGKPLSGLAAWPDYLITFALVVVAIYFFVSYLKQKDKLKILLGVMPVLTIFAFLISPQTAIFPSLLFNLYLLTFSISYIVIGFRDNALGVVNIGALILAFLIIARFFDSDINFIIKGLVFIFTGCGFLATNLMLMRRKGGVK